VLLLFFIIVAATKAQLIKQRVEMLMKVININTPAAAQKMKAS
jgi:hypothetical protein